MSVSRGFRHGRMMMRWPPSARPVPWNILIPIPMITGNEMLRQSILAALLVSSGGLAAADVPPSRDVSRGELLYTTHCVACHNAQVHWRVKKLATDWPNLQSQVHRWQGIAGLGWSKEDVAEVARYLNALYYHYPDSA